MNKVTCPACGQDTDFLNLSDEGKRLWQKLNIPIEKRLRILEDMVGELIKEKHPEL